jgi:hypothetical protein
VKKSVFNFYKKYFSKENKSKKKIDHQKKNIDSEIKFFDLKKIKNIN